MSYKSYSRFFIVLLVFFLFSFGVLSQAVASPPTQAAADAGTWQTWVLESGDQFRLDAPPDEAATAEEIAQLMAMVEKRDDAALQQIAYWNAGPPSYRWNKILMDTMIQNNLGNMVLRDTALLQVAVYDATVAAWDSKYAYNRPRPSEVDSTLETVIPNPPSPSYPSEYAVTAGAASAILSWLFPDQAQVFEDKAQEAVNSRLLAGVEYPSDVEAGLELGRQVAQLVIERGKADGSDAVWEGSIPTEPGHWTGEKPAFPLAGTWKTWVLTSGDQFRPPPPPAYDSEQMATEMAELKNFERTPVTNTISQFWQFGGGGNRLLPFWNDVTTRLILSSRWDDNAPMAARAYALANIAGYDSMVACWDGKYAYWQIRPFQLDPEFTPLFTTPNHPSYPAAHGCISSAYAGTLAALFSGDAEELLALGQQAAESRIFGGIHFRSDIDAGKKIGQQVADVVIEHAMSDGS